MDNQPKKLDLDTLIFMESRKYENLSKSQIGAALNRVAKYHEMKLAGVQEYLKKAIHEYEKGNVDAFAVDKIINQYCKQSKELSSFVNTSDRLRRSSLPLLLAMIDAEEKGVWSWEPETKQPKLK